MSDLKMYWASLLQETIVGRYDPGLIRATNKKIGNSTAGLVSGTVSSHRQLALFNASPPRQ